MADSPPRVEPLADGFCRVSGTFHRGVDPAHRDAALAGSRAAGRYAASGEPTLYLSASPAGVAAAILAHRAAADVATVAVRVEATAIVDLRDAAACRRLDIDPRDAAADWQAIVRAGGEPASWRVRRRLVAQGAAGLIDPSRRAPGLWHLVLFRWNEPGAPWVAPIG